MPTLECLDERSQQILARISSLDQRIEKMAEDFDKKFGDRLDQVEKDVVELRFSAERQAGERSVLTWLGAGVCALLGMVANMLLQILMKDWPLRPPH